MWFEVLSVLKVNVEKSEIIPIGRVDNIEVLAEAFECHVGALPSSYLGLPLGASFKSIQIGMVWRRDFVGGYLYGRGNTSPKGGD